jgi:imidazolonepropionase-like amidohydrolase
MRYLSCLLALTLALAADPVAALTLACGRLFDSTQGKLLGPHQIEIVEGKITAVRAGRAEAGADVIDHSEATCLPGLIDLHTHISSFESSPARYVEVFRLNAGDYALRAAFNARQTLRAGFTTIRDLGDSEGASIALRTAIEQGIAEGPRIYTSGKSIATTGGHADPTNGRARSLPNQPGPADGVINGPEQAYEAVRYRYKEGADLIKITATGGVLSYAKNGLNPQFSQAEIEAIVAAARDYGFRVAAHAHGKEGIRRAIVAGVTSIEHGSFMDADLFPLMKKHGTWYVPTLLAGWWTASKAEEPGYYPPMVAAKAKAISPQLRTTFAKAYAAGVQIAFGTDSGVSPHGMNAKEFALMVEAGMPPAEAIQSATRHAAEVLGASGELGVIAPGAHADIVVVAGDPTLDITLLERPQWIYKAGQAYPPTSASPARP